jgi:hypothetical protein
VLPTSGSKLVRYFREGEAANQFYLVGEGKLAIEVFAAERGALTS